MIQDEMIEPAIVNRVIMRLLVPGYEQARKYFDLAYEEGELTTHGYPKDYLTAAEINAIISKYSPR
jgi:hypothetical protein